MQPYTQSLPENSPAIHWVPLSRLEELLDTSSNIQNRKRAVASLKENTEDIARMKYFEFLCWNFEDCVRHRMCACSKDVVPLLLVRRLYTSQRSSCTHPSSLPILDPSSDKILAQLSAAEKECSCRNSQGLYHFRRSTCILRYGRLAGGNCAGSLQTLKTPPSNYKSKVLDSGQLVAVNQLHLEDLSTTPWSVNT
jgi:hypothetical protein